VLLDNHLRPGAGKKSTAPVRTGTDALVRQNSGGSKGVFPGTKTHNKSVRGRQLVLCAAAGASTLRGSGSRRRTRPFAGSEGLRLRLGTPDPTNYLAGPKPSSDDDVRQCPRTLAEHISCSLLLLEFIPMHSDSQQFVNVAFWSRAFTAITRVQIPSGTPNHFNNLARSARTIPRSQVAGNDYRIPCCAA
jgi:hypothetical protein